MTEGIERQISGNRKSAARSKVRVSHVLYFCVLAAFCFCVPAVLAQTDPTDLAPPPLKLISKDERSKLTRETNVKARTVMALEMMSARLTAAEKAAASENYDAMFKELGGFQGLMDDTLDFLTRNDNDSDRVLNNFKRLEIGLRGFVPRIEIVRRELPLRYESYVKSVIRYIRDARSRALEPLFGDTVVREPKRP